jgi:hypothetical protein
MGYFTLVGLLGLVAAYVFNKANDSADDIWKSHGFLCKWAHNIDGSNSFMGTIMFAVFTKISVH